MNVIKESFDNLPIAVCFFDRNGLVRLVNRRMLEISAVLLGTEFQTLFELRYALLAPPNKEISVIDKSFPVLRFPDGKSLRFEETEITVNSREKYTQVTAADVSKLALRQGELKEENKRLADANRRVKRLYDNMAEIVREEEILSMKMRVHDDIGHSILSALRKRIEKSGGKMIVQSFPVFELSVLLPIRGEKND